MTQIRLSYTSFTSLHHHHPQNMAYAEACDEMAEIYEARGKQFSGADPYRAKR